MESISDLGVFVAVVRAGSFVGAANKLGMTSSGVSKKISRFEQRLEVRLFNRTTRSLSLTDAGSLLFTRGGEILDSVEETEQLVKELSLSPKGTLRVAASDAFATLILVPFLRSFLEKYPDLHAQIIPGDGKIDLLDQRVDVAIRFESPKHTSFISKKLIDDPWVVCASPNYLSAVGTPTDPSDIQNHRVLSISTLNEESNSWQFSSASIVQEITINPVFSGIGLVVKEAALNGLGIARLAKFLVHSEIQNGALQPLLEEYMPAAQRAIHIVYPNRQYLPLKVRLFIDELEAFVHKHL